MLLPFNFLLIAVALLFGAVFAWEFCGMGATHA